MIRVLLLSVNVHAYSNFPLEVHFSKYVYMPSDFGVVGYNFFRSQLNREVIFNLCLQQPRFDIYLC